MLLRMCSCGWVPKLLLAVDQQLRAGLGLHAYCRALIKQPSPVIRMMMRTLMHGFILGPKYVPVQGP